MLQARVVLAAALVVCSAMLATACRGSGPRAPLGPQGKAPHGAAPAGPDRGVAQPPAQVLGEPPVAPPALPRSLGGTLRVHLEVEPPHLNPLLGGHASVSRVVGGLVYEPLIECRASGEHPGLAEAWQFSPDGLRLTLRLRADARWHDGRALNPMDVQATLETVLRSSGRLPVPRQMLADVAAVEVLPDRQVRLRLDRPSRIVLRGLCEVPILPDARAGSVETVAQGHKPVGTGPFRFVAWERGRRIRLARARPPGESPPFLDAVVFEIDPDATRALLRTRRGEIDLMPRLADAHYPEQVAPGALRDSLDLALLASDRFSFIAANHRRPPLDDARFRRALSLLWERERLAAEVHRGLARPLGGPPYAEVTAVPFDPATAERLLDEAGIRDGNGDGVREHSGASVRLVLLQPAGARGLLVEAQAWAKNLRRSGILLDFATVDQATLLARIAKGEFDLAPLVWEGARDDDPRPLFEAGGAMNHAHYRSPDLPALFDGLRLADGPAGRANWLLRIGEVVARDQAAIFLYRHDVPLVVSKRVHGLHASGDRLDLRLVWVDP